MYPPKLITYNLLEQTNTVKAGCFPVDSYEVCEDWLYIARPLVKHPYISYLRSFVIPGLAIQITRFSHHGVAVPDDYTFFDYYVDIGDVIQKDSEQWVLRDLYLDVLVVKGKAAHVLDTDEYLEAVSEKLISTEEAHFALETTHNLINGLAQDQYNLEAYLKQKGINIDLEKLK
jgi:uncharacterized protein